MRARDLDEEGLPDGHAEVKVGRGALAGGALRRLREEFRTLQKTGDPRRGGPSLKYDGPAAMPEFGFARARYLKTEDFLLQECARCEMDLSL